MAKRPLFSMKEISRQAGLSLATIDRVVHQRDGVGIASSKRVHQAIKELKQQGDLSIMRGRKFTIDIVMEAPERFSELVRQALEAELPHLQPAQFRCRIHQSEYLAPKKIIAVLQNIGKRGSNGLILKVPDLVEIREAVDALATKNVPVVTLVTDIPLSKRIAYVGIDNQAAGQTAAYLVGSWLPKNPTSVLITVSSTGFSGEAERQSAFCNALLINASHLSPVIVSEGFGRDIETSLLVQTAIQKYPDLKAVYSIGGANHAVLHAFEKANRQCDVFIAHDLDTDNRVLLRQNKINAVLHHDLRADMRRCFLYVMQANGALTRNIDQGKSALQVITPLNIPDI